MKIKEMKEQLKEDAKEIRELKNKRKTAQYGFVSGLVRAREIYRSKHFAYCLFRGRTSEEIEPTFNPNNRPYNFDYTVDYWLKKIEPLEEYVELEVVNG